jgi:hypothetical protein
MVIEVDTFIEVKRKEVEKISDNFKDNTRRLAEKAYEIEQESIKNYGTKGIKVFKEVFTSDKIGFKVAYVKNLKYIPEKIYPYADAERLSEIGYTKFLDIAMIGDDAKRIALIKEVLDNPSMSARDIRAKIQGDKPKESKPLLNKEEVKPDVQVFACPFAAVMVKVDWINKKIEWVEK